MKDYNNYTIGTCGILTNYLKRVEEKEKSGEELKKLLRVYNTMQKQKQ